MDDKKAPISNGPKNASVDIVSERISKTFTGVRAKLAFQNWSSFLNLELEEDRRYRRARSVNSERGIVLCRQPEF
jgi:hypothetical protein